MHKKTKFKTFDQMCLDKLKEIEPATRTEWALAMGYKGENAFGSILKRCIKLNLITNVSTKIPCKYKVNEEIKNELGN